MQGAFYGIIICGFRTLNICTGPLPIYIGISLLFLNNCYIIFGTIIVFFINLMRFVFIFVWKSVRQIEDDLITNICFIQAFVISVLLSLLISFHGMIDKVIMKVSPLNMKCIGPLLAVENGKNDYTYIFLVSGELKLQWHTC